MFLPLFYENYKIIKHKRLRMRNIVSDTLNETITDQTARDVHVVRFKRKFNKNYVFREATSNFVNN